MQGVIISGKKMGRPTDEPRIYERKIRFSEEDIMKIDFCCEIFKLKKSEVIRLGVNELYEKAQNIKK
jgi:hypothetical protein